MKWLEDFGRAVSSPSGIWSRESFGERCGGDGEIGYAGVDRVRYGLEFQIREFAEFDVPFDGRALEIGLGTGADFPKSIK